MQLIDLHPEPADMRRLVREGMARQPRQLPAWLLYDAEGSRLFEAICEQPEYGLTRTETALLEERAPELAAALGPGVLVEFGAGNARKAGPLLEALRPPAYVALDISANHLQQSCVALQARHPAVPVLGICCDYSQLRQLPQHPLLRGQRRLGFYPGSSIGNFSPAEAQTLLRQMAQLLGPGARLLIGVDQPKAVARLEAAYNDAAGVSAAFARNLLVRLNRDLAGDFDPEAFTYTARWQPEHSRIAMALESRRTQSVELAGETWRFAAGEPLITEYSVKYGAGSFQALAQQAGWLAERHWSDPAGDLSLHLLVTQAPGDGRLLGTGRSAMGREEQRAAMRAVREGLIAELEELYRGAFDRISDQDLGEGAIARLTQLLLRSREGAITPLQEVIEAPLITSPAGQPAGEQP